MQQRAEIEGLWSRIHDEQRQIDLLSMQRDHYRSVAQALDAAAVAAGAAPLDMPPPPPGSTPSSPPGTIGGRYAVASVCV